jgi:hypothetical protein
LHVKKGVRAISSIIIILLMLISAIVGALLAYVWTMAPFYLEPENTADLIITNVNFPANNANHFNLTVMNPSHSVLGANITDIYIESSGNNKTSITNSDPALPIFIDRGTQQTFNCTLNWGVFAGNVLTVHVLTVNNTEAALPVQTPSVQISLTALFDPSDTIQSFNATVTNDNSPINLTLSQVLFDLTPVDNLSMALPRVLQPNETVTFTCYTSWQGHINPSVEVVTAEGFTAELRSTVGSIVTLQTTSVDFNLDNTSQVNVTLANSPDSASYVNITSLTFQYGNVTDTIINGTTPTLPLIIAINQTITITCPWNWTDTSLRDTNIQVIAYTKQGFTSVPLTVTTPARYSGGIVGANFDLINTGTFSVNVTNLAYSVQAANVTEVDVDQNATVISPTLIAPGTNGSLVCSFDWSNLVGQSVTITVHLVYNSTEIQPTINMTLPYLEITNTSFSNLASEVPYVNITVKNSELNTFNATIVQVLIRNETTPLLVIESSGYEVDVGSEIGIVCSWNWIPYANENMIVVLTTADGFQVSGTFKVG